MSDPEETKPCMGVEEDEKNRDNYAQPTSLDDFYGKMTSHKPIQCDIYITLTETEIYRWENI